MGLLDSVPTVDQLVIYMADEISQREVKERLVNSLVTGKDIAILKENGSFIPAHFTSLEYKAEDRLLGLMDPLHGTVRILNLAKKHRAYRFHAGLNEMNHGYVSIFAPLIGWIFRELHVSMNRGKLPPVDLNHLNLHVQDWRTVMEATALYENLYIKWNHPLPKDLRKDIFKRIDENRTLSERLSSFRNLVEKFKVRAINVRNSDISELVRFLGFYISETPYIFLGTPLKTRRAEMAPDYTWIIKRYQMIDIDGIPRWRNFHQDLMPFLDKYCSHVEERIIRVARTHTREREGIFFPHHPSWLPFAFSSDKNRLFEPYIFGVLHHLGLIDPIVYYCDKIESPSKQFIASCPLKRGIRTRFEENRMRIKSLMASSRQLKSACSSCETKSDWKEFAYGLELIKLQVYDSLLYVQGFIHHNCPPEKDCVGRKECRLLRSHKIYDLVTDLMTRLVRVIKEVN